MHDSKREHESSSQHEIGAVVVVSPARQKSASVQETVSLKPMELKLNPRQLAGRQQAKFGLATTRRRVKKCNANWMLVRAVKVNLSRACCYVPTTRRHPAPTSTLFQSSQAHWLQLCLCTKTARPRQTQDSRSHRHSLILLLYWLCSSSPNMRAAQVTRQDKSSRVELRHGQ